jgi:hypothetical protein
MRNLLFFLASSALLLGWQPAAAAADAAGAASPPPARHDAPPPDPGTRESELGRAMVVMMRTASDSRSYQHEINDALVKLTLETVQFAKNRGVLKDLVEHDVQTNMPQLLKVKELIAKTGNREFALMGVFEGTTCHYQLALDTQVLPGKRVYTSPYRKVLDVSAKFHMFDLTEREIHENWTVPRFQRYAEVMGVKFRVSPWRDDGVVTVELVD